jgi:hypothetical protein
MNLARHAAVLWRYRRVTIAGVVIAVVLAVLASYRVSADGLSPRSSETWSAVSSIHVTQRGFPEGRVTLPTAPVGGATAGVPPVDVEARPKDQVEFADPARLAGLGDLYAKFAASDEVLRRVPERPSADQVMASPFASSQGGVLLPVVELTTTATSGPVARDLNVHVFEALRAVLRERQKENDIAPSKRVEIQLLDAPNATLLSGPSHTASILALLLCLLATVAVTHLLEALRQRRETRVLAGIAPWEDAEGAANLTPMNGGRLRS